MDSASVLVGGRLQLPFPLQHRQGLAERVDGLVEVVVAVRARLASAASRADAHVLSR